MSRRGLALIFVFAIVLAAVSSRPSQNIGKADSTSASQDSAVARVVEIRGPVRINRADRELVSINMFLSDFDTLTLDQECYIKLLLRNGPITEFRGPATLAIASVYRDNRGHILARLTVALLRLFFSRRGRAVDATGGVREIAIDQPQALRVPRLVYPPPSCHLVRRPDKFFWRPVEGIYFYTVSLYEKDDLLWQGKTNNAFINLPDYENPVRMGKDYIWLVEADVDGESLHSEQGRFTILDEETLEEVKEQLAGIDGCVEDRRLSSLLKAQAYRDYNLKVECYKEVEAILRNFPGDYTASLIKAELLEDMGLFEEAAHAYKAIVSR